jgi:hypothetical protein
MRLPSLTRVEARDGRRTPPHAARRLMSAPLRGRGGSMVSWGMGGGDYLFVVPGWRDRERMADAVRFRPSVMAGLVPAIHAFFAARPLTLSFSPTGRGDARGKGVRIEPPRAGNGPRHNVPSPRWGEGQDEGPCSDLAVPKKTWMAGTSPAMTEEVWRRRALCPPKQNGPELSPRAASPKMLRLTSP